MASWSTKRKFQYFSALLTIVILLIIVPLVYFFYTPPTCSDNKQNGNELGVDCGGSCIKLCQNSFLPPKISWGGAKFEKIADGVYNVAAYIENPNINGAALNVPYKISLYDENGMLIVEANDKVDLYPHRNSLAFKSGIRVDKRIPVKATFEFTKSPEWFKSQDNLEGLIVTDKRYNEDKISSSLEIYFENKTLYPYNNIQVSVILSNAEGNAIGFSRTIIDEILPKSGKGIAPFTWPISRNNQVKTIEVLPMIAPTFDR